MTRYTEYQPTHLPPPHWGSSPVVRVTATLTAVFCLLVVLVIALGARLPAAPVLAYQAVAGNSDALYLYDTREKLGVAALRAARIREVKWLPDGSGLILADDDHDDWYVLEQTGKRRPARRDEQLGANYLPSPGWERYLQLQDGRVLLYDAASPGWVPLLVEMDVREMAWSPDGERIAVAVGMGGAVARQVGVIDLTASSWQVVTPDPALYARMVWSPDSSTLAFLSMPNQIYVYDTRLDTTRALVHGDSLLISALGWSPDSVQVVYGVRQGALQAQPVGGGVTATLLPNLDDDTRLAWSPAGAWLAVRSGTLVEHRLTLLNIRTGERRTLPHAVSSRAFMAWQP